MNAAARLFNQGELSRAWVVSLLITRFQFFWLAFIASLILSALSLIYVTHTTRILHAKLQQEFVNHDRLYIEEGQLLLEKSSLMRQARIQSVAETKLDMISPNSQSIIVIKDN